MTDVGKNEQNKVLFPLYISGEFDGRVCQNNTVVKYFHDSTQMKQQVS